MYLAEIDPQVLMTKIALWMTPGRKATIFVKDGIWYAGLDSGLRRKRKQKA